MKKIKRYLSLLLCMVMLASFLPVGASAATINSVTVNFACPAVGDAVNLDSITLTNASFPRYATKTIKKDNQNYNKQTYEAGTYTIEFEIIPANFMQDQFANPLTVNTSDGNVNGNATITNGNYGWTTTKITLTFTVAPAHQCSYDGINAHDENEHWEECTDENCTAADNGKRNAAEHSFTSWDDVKCDACNYERDVHQHVMEYEYTDGTGHWQECVDEQCPAQDKGRTQTVPHVFGNDDLCDDCSFERQGYTVSFNANGGTGEMTSQSFIFGTKQALKANAFSKTGYTFAGWNTEANGTGVSYTNGQEVQNLTDVKNGEVTLFAQWTANTYKVVFHRNGSTDSTVEQTFTYDQAQKLSKNEFTRSTRYFANWNTVKTGTGTTYTDEQEVVNLTAVNGGEFHLYAQWVYGNTVTGISINPTSAEMYPEEEMTFTATVTGTGNNFNQNVRWSVAYAGDVMLAAAEDAATINANGKLTLAEDAAGTYIVTATADGDTTKKATATVTVLDYNTVTFAMNGHGEQVDAQKLKADEKAEEPEMDEVAGWEFNGWYADADCTVPYDFDAEVTGDITLYAKWTEKEITYEVTFEVQNTQWSGVANPAAQTVKAGEKATEPEVQNNTNQFGSTYGVSGWYTDKNCTKPYNFDTEVNADLPLYGKVERVHTVTFHGPNDTIAKTKTVFNGRTVDASGVAVEGYATPSKWYTYGWNNNRTEYDFSKTVTGNLDLYADWEEEVTTYTVTFHTEIGEAAAQTVNAGAKATDPALTAEGWELEGWYTEAGFVNKYSFDSEVNANLDLYAKWTKVHTLTYHGPDYSVVGTQEVLDGNTAGSFNPAEPVNVEGYYTPDKWYKDIDGDEKFNFEADVVNSDMDLYGEWVAESYTVIFWSDGEKVEEKTVGFSEKVVAPAVTKEGHTLDGWYTEPGFTNKYNFDNPVNTDMNLYANWTQNQPAPQYTVTFNDGNGNVIATVTGAAGTEVEAPAAPSKEGHTFDGWDVEVPESISGNLTITAKWKINQYTITFNTDGGSTVAPITADYGAAVTEPAAPTKTGHTFAGWDKTIPENMPAENLTIKAQWRINQYTITFDTDGGSNIDPITADYGAAVTEPAAPTKTGHTFAGWDKDIPANMPAENLTIKAQWTPYKLTFRFDANGGVGDTMENLVVSYGETKNLTANAYTKDGYSFAGWTTESDGSGDFYANQAEVQMNKEENATITLWAKWTKNQTPTVYYVVSFDANGGSGTMASVDVQANTVLTLPANGFKAPSGKTFKCWDVNGTEYAAGKDVIITADTTVKAVWKPLRTADLDYVPAAGDNFPIFLWTCLAFSSALALAVLLVLGKKYAKK